MSVQQPDDPVQPPQRVWRIGHGWDVVTVDGEKIGTVAEVHRHYLVVARGLLFPSERRIPVATVADVDRGQVRLGLDRAALEQLASDRQPAAPPDEPRDPEPSQETIVVRPERLMDATWDHADAVVHDGDVLELRQERLVPHREWREAGEVRVRTEVEEVPGRLELDAFRDEVEIERVPVGEVVDERVGPWEDEGVFIVPVYEEQLVVTRRLVLKEELRIHRVRASERRVFEEPLRQERVVVDEPEGTQGVQLVREQRDHGAPRADPDDGSLGSLVRRVFQ